MNFRNVIIVGLILMVGALWIYQKWARIRGVKLGPKLGTVRELLSDLNKALVIPLDQPDIQLLSEEAKVYAFDSAPTDELRRANMWAGALEQHLHENNELIPAGTELTTYGFVNIDGHTRLSVVHYLKFFSAFKRAKQDHVEVGGETFPVIVRPWLVTSQDKRGAALEGNCFVVFQGEDGMRHVGLLTANHAIRPSNAVEGAPVTINVNRQPQEGILRRRSPVMDAALVELPDHPLPQDTIYNSSVVGYKPVRLMRGGGRQPVDADIVEHDGFKGATIPGVPGQEPAKAVQLMLNRRLAGGDSGCLGLDMEFAKQGGSPMPYLIYLGVQQYQIGGTLGYSLLLEQPKRVWELEFLPSGFDETEEDGHG